jgi:hypothetical protein
MCGSRTLHFSDDLSLPIFTVTVREYRARLAEPQSFPSGKSFSFQ